MLQQLLFDAVAVEAGEYHKLERDRGSRETAGFELAGVQLHVRVTDVGERVE